MIRTSPMLRTSAAKPYSRSSSAPLFRRAPSQRSLSIAERNLKAELKTASQLLTYNGYTGALDVVGYPAYDDGQVVPPGELERYSRGRCWPDNMMCFCDLVAGTPYSSRPPRIFVPSTGVHAGSPCLGCRSYGRPGGHCSYFVNIIDVITSADICIDNLKLETFPRREHLGYIQALPMTPTRGNSLPLVGVGRPSSGSLSPLTPLSSEPSTPDSLRAKDAPMITALDAFNLVASVAGEPQAALASIPDTVRREDLLPSDDEVTSVVLGLLDGSAMGVSPTDLTRVVATKSEALDDPFEVASDEVDNNVQNIIDLSVSDDSISYTILPDGTIDLTED
ncbi:hypothetical protein EVJ58_g7890 [Rhodofomes roseus]|uniref:Uncharacterized protein n=1 Tax=Rhodofomes roseus TaxID=34475 RepID=A0A4Y9Y0R0_9APHY|nr:hypothetical protein EVJ58_g7890 [Rhodofomes roseus]